MPVEQLDPFVLRRRVVEGGYQHEQMIAQKPGGRDTRSDDHHAPDGYHLRGRERPPTFPPADSDESNERQQDVEEEGTYGEVISRHKRSADVIVVVRRDQTEKDDTGQTYQDRT